MEIPNLYSNLNSVTSLKNEFKTEPETDQNVGSSFECDPQLPLKQEYGFVKEEINIDWDENYNIYDKADILLSKNDDEASNLNNKSIFESTTNELPQNEKKSYNGNENLGTKKFHKNKNKEKDTMGKGYENKNCVMRMTVYYCTVCKKDSKISAFLSNHQNYCLDCGSNLVFKCIKCKKQYGLYSSIVYHLKRVCDPKNILKCSKCDYTGPLISLINKHYRMTHDRKVSYCSSCGRKYKNPESLRKHLYRCTRTFYYNCNDCNYKTKIKSALIRHIAVKHLKKKDKKLPSN